MQRISETLTKEIDALLNRHCDKGFYKADLMGQALDGLSNCCAGNSVNWVLGGLAYAHATNSDAVGVLKRLVTALERSKGHVNYNDMDCDLRGWHKVIEKGCLNCTSILAKVEKHNIKTADCPRCKGTGIDPEYRSDAWVVHFNNHGNGCVFAVIESCIGIELHIRNLPYNISRDKEEKILKEVLKSVCQDRYDHPLPLLHYRDTRDEGFVMSLSYEKEREDEDNSDLSHECEANGQSIFALDTIIEHFTCVIESLEKGEEP